jgi:transposase InsO family protein
MRRILGWRVSRNTRAPLVTDALRQALEPASRSQILWESTGLVHHSDAGSQYTSVAFSVELLGLDRRRRRRLDNALCESTIGLFKTEAIDLVDGG